MYGIVRERQRQRDRERQRKGRRKGLLDKDIIVPIAVCQFSGHRFISGLYKLILYYKCLFWQNTSFFILSLKNELPVVASVSLCMCYSHKIL